MKSDFELSYMNIMGAILAVGTSRNDRTGVGTLAMYNTMMHHNWCDGFPAITHRTLNPRSAMAEMVCFIRGFTDVREFEARGCRWWRANLNDFNKRNGCPENLELGPIYGYKWRNFHGVDQLANLLEEAQKSPHSRRLMVSSWDPSDQHKAVLPPCHYAFQIFIDGDELDLSFSMRSVDWVLGCPADMSAYGFLQLAICRHLGKNPRLLFANFADTHIYKNHIKGAEELLSTQVERSLPKYKWADDAPTNLFELEAEHLILTDFSQGPSYRFEMAV